MPLESATGVAETSPPISLFHEKDPSEVFNDTIVPPSRAIYIFPPPAAGVKFAMLFVSTNQLRWRGLENVACACTTTLCVGSEKRKAIENSTTVRLEIIFTVLMAI